MLKYIFYTVKFYVHNIMTRLITQSFTYQSLKSNIVNCKKILDQSVGLQISLRQLLSNCVFLRKFSIISDSFRVAKII